MDEFTFPTIAASEPDPVCHHLPFPHFATSPIWFPSSPSSPSAAAGAADKNRMEASNRDRLEVEGNRAVPADMEDEEKMDLLWENFNEELYHASDCPKLADMGLEPLDMESGAERGHSGCVPMLRMSSRAGGTSHYRRTTSWVLLMRIFRRLFVIEKTISAARGKAQ